MNSTRNLTGFAFAFSLLLAGCSNNLQTGSSASAQTYVNPLIQNPAPVATTTSSYSCPNAANVVPDYDSEADGSDFFTVCPSTLDTTDIEVSGRTVESATICMFPAQVTSGQLYWKPDVNGNPSYVCSQITGSGALATFPNMSYNALFVVENQNLSGMEACLKANNYNICPSFSYGQFRQ